MTETASPDLLATIVAATRRAVAVRQSMTPMDDLRRHMQRQPQGSAFVDALRLFRVRQLIRPPLVNVIAEKGHQIRRSRCDMAMRTVLAELPMLARSEGKTQRGRQGIGSRRG